MWMATTIKSTRAILLPGVAAPALATVTDQCVAQRVFERTEPRLVVSPEVESLTIDRLAHLLGTRVRTLRSVLWNSTQAGSNGKFAVVENPANAPLQILDHVFVVHAQDSARAGRSSQCRMISR